MKRLLVYASKVFAILLIGVFAMGSAHAQTVFASSTFDTGKDGWSSSGLDFLYNMRGTFRATGGDPGGFLFGRQTFGSQPSAFDAPATFLGDLSPCYGGSLSFSIQEKAGLLDAGQVQILSNSGSSLINHFGALPASWGKFTLALTLSGGWVTPEGGIPTESEIRTSLLDVQGLLIGVESAPLVSGQFGLDNVVLSTGAAAPEPSTMGLLVGAGLPCALLIRRRKK